MIRLRNDYIQKEKKKGKKEKEVMTMTFKNSGT